MTVEQTPQFLQVRATQSGPGAVCVTVAGELDLCSADALGVQVRAALDQRHPASVELDLSRLEFIDIAGVRALCELHAYAATAGCTMTISHAPRTARWILSALGLDGIFAMTAARA